MEGSTPDEEAVNAQSGQALHDAGEVAVDKNNDGKGEREVHFEAPRRSWSTFARRTPKIKSASAPDNKIAAAADDAGTTSATSSPEPTLLSAASGTSTSASAGSSPTVGTLAPTPASFSSGTSLSSSAIPVVAGPAAVSPAPPARGMPLYLSSSSLLGGSSKSSGLKWFQRKSPSAVTLTTDSKDKQMLSPRGGDSDKKDQQPDKTTTSGQLETICPVSYADLKRQLDTLKRENNRLRFENSHLFKELDIVHRQLSLKLRPPTSTLTPNKQNSLDILNSQTNYSYNIDTNLSYSLPLDEFLEQYYKDYPESIADLTIYQRKGKLASFSIRNGTDGVGDNERSKIKANLESALISQEDGKSTESTTGEGHESFIPTIVKRQFARDVPSMVRINGKIVNGRTDNEKVLIAYRILHDGLAGNEKLVNLVMSLANQNLGIFMYEKLVKHYTQIGMIVKQSWHHYLDITLSRVKINKYTNNKNVVNELVDEYLRKERAAASTAATNQPSRQKYEDGVVYLSEEESNGDHDVTMSPNTRLRTRKARRERRRAPVEPMEENQSIDEEKAKLVEGIGIYMLAIFELQNTDLDGAPLFIKGMMEINFRNSPDGGAVNVLYSTPAFDVLSFVHSIDLDGSLNNSGAESEESATDDDDESARDDNNIDDAERQERKLSADNDDANNDAQKEDEVVGTSTTLHDDSSGPIVDSGTHAKDNSYEARQIVDSASEAKMKEAHGDDQLAAFGDNSNKHIAGDATTAKRASAPSEEKQPQQQLQRLAEIKPSEAERPRDITNGGGGEDDDEKVVVQKGRRRRVLSMRELDLTSISASKATMKIASTRDESAPLPPGLEESVGAEPGAKRERAKSLGRKEDEEWFRRMEEEAVLKTSPRGSAPPPPPSSTTAHHIGTGKEN